MTITATTTGTTTKSPFFRPSSKPLNHRIVIVQERTPNGKHISRVLQKQQPIQTEKKSTLIGTASNLVNAIVGAGIVGIPFAIRQSGLVSGILLIVLCAYVTEKSLQLLINTAKHVHVPTYETLAEACFGTVGYRFVAMNMFLTAFGAMISYLMIVKQTFGTLLLSSNEEDILHHRAIALDTVYMRRTILLIISIGIMLPVACKRDIADLAHTSRFNVIVDTLLVVLVALTSPILWYNRKIEDYEDGMVTDTNDTSTVESTITEASSELSSSSTFVYDWIFRGDTIFIGLGVLSFAYVCQHSAFIIAGSLQQPTSKRWSIVTTYALIVCCILNLICGIMGYLGYKEETQGNILENLGRNNIPANIARSMLGTTMLFVYPVESFVARHACIVLLFTGRSAHEGNDAQILSRSDRRIGLTTFLYICAIIPAAITNDLGPILAITGTVGGSCLSYLGPGVIYLGVHGQRFLELVRQTFGGSNASGTNNEFDIDSNNNGTTTTKNSLRAIETTPLVRTSENNSTTNEFDTTISSDAVRVVGVWNHIVYYCTFMPLWCCIARYGTVRLQEHITEMAMKSPHPIRIGDVVYKKMVLPLTNNNNTTNHLSEGSSIGMGKRDSSVPQLSNMMISPSSSAGVLNINQQIGQGLLEQQRQKKHVGGVVDTNNNEAITEVDPQEEPPTWYDFYIAIFLILLGCVALIAGMYSIFLA